MTAEEMLIEIVKYKYKCYGFPYVFLDYCQQTGNWSITWRNPIKFTNDLDPKSKTPIEACQAALDFIKNNPTRFWLEKDKQIS